MDFEPVFRVPTVNLCHLWPNPFNFYQQIDIGDRPYPPSASASPLPFSSSSSAASIAGNPDSYSSSASASAKTSGNPSLQHPLIQALQNQTLPFPQIPEFPFWELQQECPEAFSSTPPVPLPPPEEDPQNCETRKQLIKLFLNKGHVAIRLSKSESLINKILATKSGIIGADEIGKVDCKNHPCNETFFCFVCKFWCTPKNIVGHLQTEEHHLMHMKCRYKKYYHKIQVSRKRNRQGLIDKYVGQIEKVEEKRIIKKVDLELDLKIIKKGWPSFSSEINESWKFEGEIVANMVRKKAPLPIINNAAQDNAPPPIIKKCGDVKPENRLPPIIEEVADIENVKLKPFETKPTIPVVAKKENTISSPKPFNTQYSFLELAHDDDAEEGEITFAMECGEACLRAWIFIRDEALKNGRIDENDVEKICDFFKVSSGKVFCDESLEYVGSKIGNIEVLVAIAKKFEDPTEPLQDLLEMFGGTSDLPAASSLLLQIGLNEFETIKLIQDVQEKLHPTPKIPVFNDGGWTRPLIKYYGDYIEGNETTAAKKKKPFQPSLPPKDRPVKRCKLA